MVLKTMSPEMGGGARLSCIIDSGSDAAIRFGMRVSKEKDR